MRHHQDDESRRSFGQAIRKLRNSRALSQGDLALRAGLDRAQISLIENGQREPRLSTICALASGLGISVSKLMRTVPPTERSESA